MLQRKGKNVPNSATALCVAIPGEMVYNTKDIGWKISAERGGITVGKKKVLFVATVVKTHIMQFHLPYLKMFQDMGWETAVASRNDYENPEDCRIPYCDHFYDIPFDRLPLRRENLEAYRQLKALIDRENYDIVHCHTPVGAMIARLAARSARKRGTKVIYTAHGFHFFQGAPAKNWLLYYPAEWVLGPLTDVLITINREDYDRARKHIHARRIEYVPGVGVDTGRFRATAGLREDKRRELGFGPEDFLLLTVAEMTANKNHITVLNALAQMQGTPALEKTHYLIVGRGEQRPALEQAAKALGLEGRVHFLGYREDAAEIYRACDLFVFMPYREGLPVALMEAMSSGMAIVCTKIRGNADLVEDGISGQFCENDPAALASAIQALEADPERRAALGRGAEERAKDFDAASVHRQMKEIYLSVSR